MASHALYRKWRSQTFDEIIGQQHVTQTLINALSMDRIAHAYLFSGPRGTGKTSTARLLAKAVNCLAPEIEQRPCNSCDICVAVTQGRLIDLIEIDAASNTGVDDIRDLREKVGFRPAQARIKFYIIDEVHMLSNSAFNALLKTLEEPPDHVIFVLATTEPEKIPATITSRCQRFDFKRIRLDEIIARLEYILSQEGFQAEPQALEYIARQGGGSMRDAISLLDQMIAYGDDTITLDLVQSVLGIVASQSVLTLVDALVAQDTGAGLDLINQVIGDGVDPRQFAREIVEHLRAVLLTKLARSTTSLNLPDETLAIIKQQAERVETAFLVRATNRFNAALVDVKSSMLAIPQLPLELAFVEATMPLIPAATPELPDMAAPLPPPASPRVAAAAPVQPAAAAPPPSMAASPTSRMPEPPDPSLPVTLETVHRRFDDILAIIEPRSRPMAEALRNSRLHQIEGNEIQMITFALMKKKFEKPEPKAALNDAFSRIIGQNVVVRFFTEDDIPPTSSSSGKPAESAQSTQTDSTSEALAKMATEELGGKIVD